MPAPLRMAIETAIIRKKMATLIIEVMYSNHAKTLLGRLKITTLTTRKIDTV